MERTYTRQEIWTGFAKWIEETKGKELPDTDNAEECTEILCNYMEEAETEDEDKII